MFVLFSAVVFVFLFCFVLVFRLLFLFSCLFVCCVLGCGGVGVSRETLWLWLC